MQLFPPAMNLQLFAAAKGDEETLLWKDAGPRSSMVAFPGDRVGRLAKLASRAFALTIQSLR